MSDKPNTRARSGEIQEVARVLLKEQGIDVNKQVAILPLAKLLAEETGCHLTTAKTHVATAIRRARGDISREREWGGPRPKPLGERKAWAGKIRIGISIEAAEKLQRLMLRFVEGVNSPEEMLEYLIRKEIENDSCNDVH